MLFQVLKYLAADGILAPAAIIGAAMVAGFVTAFEALLFKGLVELGRLVHEPGQRAAVVLAVAVFAGIMLLVDLRLAEGARALGRRIEGRLRIDFLGKLVRLPDAYFSRRLTSDLTLRIHSVVQVRGVPHVGASTVRSMFSLLFVTAGIIWVDPGCAPYAMIAMLAALGLPVLFQSRLGETQLAVATYQGGLSCYLLDALLGSLPLRTHVGQDVLRSEHDRMLDRWAGARRSLIRTSVLLDTLISAAGMAMSGLILYVHLGRARDTSSVLLLLFWAQQLPMLGRVFARSMMEYPARRAAAARILEPINTEDEPQPRGNESSSRPQPCEGQAGVAVAFRAVRLDVGRSWILAGIDFELRPGCHCAVVGPSGSGKSSLLGLLLGCSPSAGRIEVDGRVLDACERERLREATAWIDPLVQLWNHSLFYNLMYGVRAGDRDMAEIIDIAGLRPTVDKLPEGLNTPLGDGGGLLSQGEGQRVRLARALCKRDARLVLLDEPLGNLDRESRARHLERLRRWWPNSTMLCVTHDVSETLSFDRVIVVDEGRIVEEGRPEELARRPGSIYRDMLEAERRVRSLFDESSLWSRWIMEEGRLTVVNQRISTEATNRHSPHGPYPVEAARGG